jgi:HSP20 family protein
MGTAFGPTFVEAERMFEKMADMTKQVANRAFEFFTERGGEFGRELDDWFKAETELLRPAPIDMTETDKEVKVRAAVAGFKPEEIEISVKDRRLILSGKCESSEKRESGKRFYSEWKSDHFLRDLALPQEVDADNARASLKDGVLEITLPKTKVREAKKVSIH